MARKNNSTQRVNSVNLCQSTRGNGILFRTLLPLCLPVPHSLIHYKLAAHLAELLLYCCTIQCSPRKEEEHESKNKRLKHRKCINWPVMSTIKVKVCTTRCTKNGRPSSGTSLHCCIQKKRCVSYLVAFMLVGWWMVRK